VKGVHQGKNSGGGRKPEHMKNWRRANVLGCARLCTVATPTRCKILAGVLEDTARTQQQQKGHCVHEGCVRGTAYTWPVAVHGMTETPGKAPCHPGFQPGRRSTML
jgi:hypothetical protein